MNPEEIKSTVYEIRQSNLNEKELRRQYPKFVEECPRLFEFVMDKNIDLKYLELMFENLALIGSNKINLDTADSNVYSILRQDYIPNFQE